MEYQVVRLRDIYWESDLVHNLDLREAPMLGGKLGRLMAILRALHWEAPLMKFQVGRLRYIHWDSNLVHMVDMR